MPEYFFPAGTTPGNGGGPPTDFDDLAALLQQGVFTDQGQLVFDDNFELVQQGE